MTEQRLRAGGAGIPAFYTRTGYGTKVAEVKLVVPLRDLVFTVAAEAKKAGFSGVLYPADDGSFWNPDPPGNWADPPMGAESAKPSKPRAKTPKAR